MLAHADLALSASGTVTVEAALLGTPMVTFYRVTGLSWMLGKFLVATPFYSMVNLVAGRRIVPELMQNEVRGERLAAEALRLLSDVAARDQMRKDLASVAASLACCEAMPASPPQAAYGAQHDPMDRAAGMIETFLRERHKA